MAKKDIRLNGCYQKNGSWWRKVSVPLGNKRYKQIHINLDTTDNKIAELRNGMINNEIENVQINGNKWKFAWQNDAGRSINTGTTLSHLTTKFLNYKRIKQSSGTLEVYQDAFNHLLQIRYVIPECDITESFDLTSLNPEHMIHILEYYDYRMKLTATDEKEIPIHPIKVTTVHKNIRCIKAFMNWLYEQDVIKKVPKLENFSLPDKEPKHFTEYEMILVEHHILDNYDPFLYQVFKLYMDTGMRLREPYLDTSTLKDNSLFIKPNKKCRPRRIRLTDPQLNTLNKMMESNYLPAYWSNKFRYILRDLGIEGKSFHNLRDTFITRKYYLTGDIYSAMGSVGHRKIETTMKYCNFEDDEQLKEDFPSIHEIRTSRGDVAHLSTLS